MRELRQDASALVRRVEAGESIVITVAGRPSARLVPVVPRRWARWSAVQDALHGPADPHWTEDRDLVDQSLVDPWEGR